MLIHEDMKQIVYIVKEHDSGKVRYAFSEEFYAESLKKQIETIEDIDVDILEEDYDSLTEDIIESIDSKFYYFSE